MNLHVVFIDSNYKCMNCNLISAVRKIAALLCYWMCAFMCTHTRPTLLKKMWITFLRLFLRFYSSFKYPVGCFCSLHCIFISITNFARWLTVYYWSSGLFFFSFSLSFFLWILFVIIFRCVLSSFFIRMFQQWHWH